MSPHAYLMPLLGIAACAMCVLTVYVSWRALFSDRGEGKRRCPRCWYDLAYSTGMVCNECGHRAANENEFHRTRRRPLIAITAMVICVGMILLLNDQLTQRGMVQHIPTRLLLWMLPFSGGMDGPLGTELDRRATIGRLTDAQWSDLVRRCARGDWFCQPVSDEWIANYGNFLESWRNRFVARPQLEEPLASIPPLLTVRTREVWPEESAIVAAVRLDDWWPSGTECRLRAIPRLEGARPVTFYRSGDFRFRPSPFSIYLPSLPAGDHDVVIDFEISRRRIADATARVNALDRASDSAGTGDAAPWEDVGTYSITLSTRIQGALEHLMKPATSESLNNAIAQVFGNAVKWQGGMSPVRFGINAPATFTSEFDQVAVGVAVELERDGIVARRLNLWWLAGTRAGDERRNYGFEIQHEDMQLLALLTPEDAGDWTLRVRSDPMLAWRAGPTTHYWQGDVSLPIALRENQTSAPPRLWWTDQDSN